VAILDPDNPYRYVQVRGRVARVAEQGADAHIDQLERIPVIWKHSLHA
jgi:hypothetical protein